MPIIGKKSKEFNFFIEDYMINCKMRDLSRKTMDSYEKTLKLFSKYLEEEYQITEIDQVENEHIKDYIKFTQNRGKYSYVGDDKTIAVNNPAVRKDFGKKVSNCTVNNYIRNLRAFFNWAKEIHIIRKNPMEGIAFLKDIRKAKDEITDEEFKRLIKAIDSTQFHGFRDYVICQLIMDTGMRLGETLNLNDLDIDIDKRIILIPGEIAKSKKDRYVFFGNSTAALLRKWLQYRDRYTESNGFVFVAKRSGKPLDVKAFETNFRKYKELSKIDKNISPHALRNNFARRCLMRGMDIYTLSKILGHSSVAVTEKAYLDLTVTDLRKNYQKFSPIENLGKKYD